MEHRLPLISVITVSYNAVETIENTILSVINQTYSNIEYIIIDGGSKDGTVDVIKKYADKIYYWVCEPDKGIYDAMNKGIDAATGEWINFMNSGDTFFSNQIINKVVENIINNNIDVLYGDTMLKYSWGVLEKKASHLNTIQKHMPFSHQSCFIKMNVMKKFKYNLGYRICADHNFFYQLYLNDGCFGYLPFSISIYEAEYGFSSINWHTMYKEAGDITGESKKIMWILRFFLLRLYYCLNFFLKRNHFRVKECKPVCNFR